MATKKSVVRGVGVLPAKNSAIAKTDPKDQEQEDATPYTQALSRLEPLQPVLAGLAHRNHNQHRRAAWWRHFGMMRRNCARLVEDLVAAVAAARKSATRAAKAAKAEGKKRRREELVTGMKTGVKDSADDVGARGVVETDENVERHATWVRDVLVPKCYLAFSQLTADPQFAPLGVVLLGVLAQIQAACDIAAPVQPSSSAPDIPAAAAAAAESRPSHIEDVTPIIATPKAGSADALSASKPMPIINKSEAALAGENAEIGGGKTISRADVERASAQPKKAKESKTEKDRDSKIAAAPSERAKSGAPAEISATTASLLSSKRQASGGGDGGVSRPTKKTKTVTVTRDADKSISGDKKKKSKKGKGDEFDDLFKGLF
ncbi:hypothetical protein F5Y03DRAFT_341545 [Xylaria venustula]|nr:hypothetical protein F5Y03DRAFT_341545 [Xylaria venustula]